MVTRILTGSCIKCKGAMKESIEHLNEWSCMNCGLLILGLSEAEKEVQDLSQSKYLELQGLGRHGPYLPGEESAAAKVKRLQIEGLEALVDPDESEDLSQGDDIEWKRLNP